MVQAYLPTFFLGPLQKGGLNQLQHVFFLSDLASGWPVNLTTFSQAFPSAYRAPRREVSLFVGSFRCVPVLSLPPIVACAPSQGPWDPKGGLQQVHASGPTAPLGSRGSATHTICPCLGGPATWFTEGGCVTIIKCPWS